MTLPVPLPDPSDPAPGDLAVTALYTSQAWVQGGFTEADLFESVHSRRVFGVVNAVMRVARWFRGGPSLPHSLHARHRMIDRLVGNAPQVLEVAAGLSRRGTALSADGRRYVEVDLPHVVAHKEALLARTPRGRDVLERPNLQRVAADVEEVDLPSLVEDGPLTVVAEGLLMYLDADAQRALWARFASLLAGRPDSQLLFDLTPAVEQPTPGLVGRVLGWLMSRFTGGRGFVRDTRTREDLRRELLAAGFAEAEVLEPEGSDRTDATEIQVVLFRARP